MWSKVHDSVGKMIHQLGALPKEFMKVFGAW